MDIDPNSKSQQEVNSFGVDFRQANFQYANLEGLNLNTARLDEADLSYADMHNVSLGIVGTVLDFCFDKRRKSIVTVDDEGQIKTWNLSDGRETDCFLSRQSFDSATLSDNGRRALVSNKGVLRFIDTISGREIQYQQPASEWTISHSVSSDGTLILIANSAGKITLHNAKNFELLNQYPKQQGMRSKFSFGPYNDTIYLLGEDGVLKRRAINTGRILNKINVGSSLDLTGFVISADDSEVVLASESGRIIVYSNAQNRIIDQLDCQNSILCVDLHCGSTDRIYFSDADGRIFSWNRRIRKKPEICLDSPSKFSFFTVDNIDGENFLARRHESNSVEIWNLGQEKIVRILRQELNCKYTNIFSAKGLKESQKRALLKSGAIDINPERIKESNLSVARFVKQSRLSSLAARLRIREPESAKPILVLGPATFTPFDESHEGYIDRELVSLFYAAITSGRLPTEEDDDRQAQAEFPTTDMPFANDFSYLQSMTRNAFKIAKGTIQKNPSLADRLNGFKSLVSEGHFPVIIDFDIFSPVSQHLLPEATFVTPEEFFSLPSFKRMYRLKEQLWNESKVYVIKVFDKRQYSPRIHRMESLLEFLLSELFFAIPQSRYEPLVVWTGVCPWKRLPPRIERMGNMKSGNVYLATNVESSASWTGNRWTSEWLEYSLFSDFFVDLKSELEHRPKAYASETPGKYLEELSLSNKIDDRLNAITLFAPLLTSRSLTDLKTIDLAKKLSNDLEPMVRRKLLSLLLNNFETLDESIVKIVYSFVHDPDEGIRAQFASTILNNFALFGRDSEALIFDLAKTSGSLVQQEIIVNVSRHFPLLPKSIRDLASSLIEDESRNISIEILSGGGMLVGKSNTLLLKCTNNNSKPEKHIAVEIQKSADYTIEGSNKTVISSLEPHSETVIQFFLTPKVTSEFPVNLLVDEQLREPALRFTAVRDNPYIYGNPISEPSAFVGRTHELEDILQAITKPNKQDVLLLGERRSGKTSLLYQVQDRLSLPFIPIYIVLNEVEATANAVVEHLRTSILDQLFQRHILTSSAKRELLMIASTLSFTNFIGNVFDAAGNKTLRLVLLLDEGDQLCTISEQIQNSLRAALQSREVGLRLRAVVGGTSELKNYVSDKSSPFFNHFRFVTLTPLEQNETRQLIEKPAQYLGYRYTADSIDLIIDYCGGHPYYCQLICYEVFRAAEAQLERLISVDIVEKTIQKIVCYNDEAFHGFKTYFWDTATNEEKAFLKALSTNKQKKMQFVAKKLLDRQLLKESDKKVSFSAVLFKKWIERLVKRR